MRKQKTHTLPIMRPANRLRKRRTNIHNPQPLTAFNLLPKRDRIRNHNSTQTTPIQRLNRIPAQNPMRDNSYHLSRFMRHYCFRGFDERAASIGHVVYEDGNFVLYVADEDHAGDFVGARALFVDEGEAEVEAVGNGCCSISHLLA
jgi:hypothetical protein